MQLEQNVKGLCAKFGVSFTDFLNDMEVDHVMELTVHDLEAICEEYEVDMQALLFKQLFSPAHLSERLQKIRCLVLDVDGVMTDGGMYYTEKGDQFKKYNTKDGMAIFKLMNRGFQVAIISSGFSAEMVRARAKTLGIQHCFVSREPKARALETICTQLQLDVQHVAVIGDDLNDIEIMEKCGISACPSDAVELVKRKASIVLHKKGGHGCIREFIDHYLLIEE
jgi:3-deoxy-D-manno-octulosonate 8-phosphate phosphatase (KDO 8-P phosphatase)